MAGNPTKDFFVNLASGIVGDPTTPGGMLGYVLTLGFVGFGLRKWHVSRFVQGKRGLDSWYIIVAAMMLALLSFGVACYGIGQRTAVVPDGHNPKEAVATAPAVAAADNTILESNRIYSAKHKEDLSGRIDKIADEFNGRGEEILREAEVALNRSPWDRPGENLIPFIDRMNRICDMSLKLRAGLYEDILGKEREYRVEMNKILFPIEPIIDFQREAKHFLDGLSVWDKLRAKEDSKEQLLQLVHASRMNFAISRDRFVSWIENRQALIAKARRELKP